MSKGCIARKTCSLCSKPHPTSLHETGFHPQRNSTPRPPSQPSTQAQGPAAAASTPNRSNVDDSAKIGCVIVDHSTVAAATPNSPVSSKTCTYLAVLPVRVQQKGRDQFFEVNCFYDSGSSGCFISTQLFEKMQPNSASTHLQLRTMHSSTIEQCMAVDDLVVSDTQGFNPIVIPRSFTRTNFPFGDFAIPTADQIRCFDALKDVAEHLPPSLGGSIDLLIGANCPLALEPLQVVSDPDSCPLIGIRLRHGWTILGSSDPDAVGSLLNYSIVAQERHTEISSPPLIKSLHDSESNDSVSHDVLACSKQDKKFEQGHRVLPLPFEDPSVCCTAESIRPKTKMEANLRQSMDSALTRTTRHTAYRNRLRKPLLFSYLVQLMFASLLIAISCLGAERELYKAVHEGGDVSHSTHLQHVDWKFNPPDASHMGGSWERLT